MRRCSQMDEVFAKADEIENAVEIFRKRLDDLEEAILCRAFRGELVPQDPNDKPASFLLKKIRSQRVEISKKGKTQTLLG